jgi:hypothetical protein
MNLQTFLLLPALPQRRIPRWSQSLYQPATLSISLVRAYNIESRVLLSQAVPAETITSWETMFVTLYRTTTTTEYIPITEVVTIPGPTSTQTREVTTTQTIEGPTSIQTVPGPTSIQTVPGPTSLITTTVVSTTTEVNEVIITSWTTSYITTTFTGRFLTIITLHPTNSIQSQGQQLHLSSQQKSLSQL